jgi:hypothetical protein
MKKILDKVKKKLVCLDIHTYIKYYRKEVQLELPLIFMERGVTGI